MEIVPPSYTGDPNAARCSESAFKYGFYCFNAAVAYDRIGMREFLNFGHAFSGDYLVAVAEEVRARAGTWRTAWSPRARGRGWESTRTGGGRAGGRRGW